MISCSIAVHCVSRENTAPVPWLGGYPTRAELLFEVCSQRYERGSVIATSNLPFEDWTSVFGSERLTGALLDCLTQSKGRRRKALPP